MNSRHFPYKHPTFGTVKNPKTPSHWKVSVYYWWYEYLKRNAEYRKTCLQEGKGKYSKIYEHFGDVTVLDFKAWWTDNNRGAVLFADPPVPAIRVLSTVDGDETPLKRDNVLILEVPMDLPINFLIKNFRKIVSKRHGGKRGNRQGASSKALFQAKGKIDVPFLEIALTCWDARNRDPKKPLWQIGQEIGIGGENRITLSDTAAAITDKKNILGATVSRYIRKATRMIQLTGEGRFPH